MRALAANIEEVFREAAARWTLVAYFTVSSLFVLLFAVAVNLDVVNGALAGAKIFGQNVHMGRQTVDLDKLVLGFESGFAGFLYVVGTFLAIFATAHLVPRLMEKGTVDLYLSRPVGRVPLLLSRYLGGLLLAASNVVYLLGAMWLLVMRYVDLSMMISPEFSPAGHNMHFEAGEHASRFFVSWLDLAAPLAIGGLWLWMFFTQLAQRPLLAVGDPYLRESLESSGGH